LVLFGAIYYWWVTIAIQEVYSVYQTLTLCNDEFKCFAILLQRADHISRHGNNLNKFFLVVMSPFVWNHFLGSFIAIGYFVI